LNPAGTVSPFPDLNMDPTLGGLTSPVSGPLDLALFGARRATGQTGVLMNFTKSPRTRVNTSLRISRDAALNTQDQSGSITPRYPSLTFWQSNVGVTHDLSRQSRMNVTFSYGRTQGQLFSFEMGESNVTYERLFGLRSFWHVSGGYGWMSDFSGTRGIRPGYNGGFGVGTRRGWHAFTASVLRRLTDQRGLGSQAYISTTASWRWENLSSVWAYGSSISYERMSASSLGTLGGWVSNSQISRRLSRTTQLTFDVGYAGSSQGLVSSPADMGRRGARVGLVWSPGSGQVRR
jgi:hypothetical protein